MIVRYLATLKKTEIFFNAQEVGLESTAGSSKACYQKLGALDQPTVRSRERKKFFSRYSTTH